ncbi:hypothetical protein, partial [Bacteroides caccae]|uniref:hypothetical protein n=1 Tax=Bacteroides caccae TaxID=47678 RepID=UPI0012311E91
MGYQKNGCRLTASWPHPFRLRLAEKDICGKFPHVTTFSQWTAGLPILLKNSPILQPAKSGLLTRTCVPATKKRYLPLYAEQNAPAAFRSMAQPASARGRTGAPRRQIQMHPSAAPLLGYSVCCAAGRKQCGGSRPLLLPLDSGSGAYPLHPCSGIPVPRPSYGVPMEGSDDCRVCGTGAVPAAGPVASCGRFMGRPSPDRAL